MKKNKAFTLVELLVVISIIALLLSILMPTLGKARQQAQMIVCQTNLKQWGSMFALYANDNNGKNHSPWPIQAEVEANGGQWLGLGHLKRLAVMLFKPYYQDSQLLLCPSTKLNGTNGAAVWLGKTWGPNGLNWGMDANMVGSYGENIWTANPPFDVGVPYSSKEFWGTMFVKGASTVPLFIDSGNPYLYPHSNDRPRTDESNIYERSGYEMNFAAINRHSGILNSLFLDASLRKVGIKELWTLKWSKNFNTRDVYTTAGGMTAGKWPLWMRKFKEY